MSKEYIEREAAVAFLENMAASRYLIQCFENNEKFPAADVAPVVHAHWTGKLTSDEALAEGVPATATEEEREEYQKWKDHRTHCSNCKGGFDDRRISDWKYCPYCGAKMEGGKK